MTLAVRIAILAGLLSILGPGRLLGQSIDARLSGAAAVAGRTEQHQEVVKVCTDVIADKAASADQKIRAYTILADTYSRNRKPDEALSAAAQMLRAMPKDPKAERASLLLQADLHSRWGRYDQAVSVLRDLIGRQSDDRGLLALSHLKMAEALLEMRKADEAYAAAAKALESGAGDEQLSGRALYIMADMAWRMTEYDKCAQAAERLLRTSYLQGRDETTRQIVRQRFIDSLLNVGRFDEAAAAFADLEKQGRTASARQLLAVAAGDSFAKQGRYDHALAAYERVFTEHSESHGNWFATQLKIANALLAKGKTDDGIRAARICLGAAAAPDTYAEVVRVISEALKQADADDVQRANRFINYQRFGPAGEDGTTGTADDLKDPLEDIGYPSYPVRDKAFIRSRAGAGDGAQSSRYRALTYIYSGRPSEAMAHYLDAFSRASSDEMQKLAEELVFVGLRAARGHSGGLEEACLFVAYGPAGPDGKNGTDDDLKDPFPAGTPKSADGKGGLAGLSKEDIDALQTIQKLLQEMMADPREDSRDRKAALIALMRVHEALNDWGLNGTAQAYRKEMAAFFAFDRDLPAVLAQSAAKGGAHHLGPLRLFWQEVDAAGNVSDKLRARTSYQNTIRSMERKTPFAGKLKPYPLPKLQPTAPAKAPPNNVTK